MSKWIPAIVIFIWTIAATVLWGKATHEVSTLKDENTSLSRQIKAEQAKYQGLIEEYNALKDYQSEGDAKKKRSKEATDVAIENHNRHGSFTRASDYDARLLKQRSLEVRGEAAGTTGQPNRSG